MFAKLEHGQVEKYPYTLGDLRRCHPHTSFPRVLTDALMADYGLVEVRTAEYPEIDPVTHEVKAGTPVKHEDVWVQPWDVIPCADAADRVRAVRNRKLAASDWTQVADAPVDKATWAVYRQALREVPQQEGFPLSIVWPVEPE